MSGENARHLCLLGVDTVTTPVSTLVTTLIQDNGARVFALNGFDGMPSIMSFR